MEYKFAKIKITKKYLVKFFRTKNGRNRKKKNILEKKCHT